jgi:hypothetical protein
MRMGAHTREHLRGLMLGPQARSLQFTSAWLQSRRPRGELVIARQPTAPARLLPAEQRRSREGGIFPCINRTDTVVVPG